MNTSERGYTKSSVRRGEGICLYFSIDAKVVGFALIAVGLSLDHALFPLKKFRNFRYPGL